MTMSMNLKDYVKIYDDFLDQKFCKTVIKNLKKDEWEKHSFYVPAEDNRKSYDTDFQVSLGKNLKESTIINEKLWHIIKKYISEDKNIIKWFSGWNGYTLARFNRYDKNTEMREHCDHIHSIFDGTLKGVPVLSMLGALNDNYEGGDLIMWQDQKIELKAGQIMVFPSNFLYPHKVTPVTKGARYSYVSWVW